MKISEGGLAQALLKYDDMMHGKVGNLADRITAMREAIDAANRYEVAQAGKVISPKVVTPHEGVDRRTAAVGHVPSGSLKNPFEITAQHRPGAAEREEIANARAQAQAAKMRDHPARYGLAGRLDK